MTQWKEDHLLREAFRMPPWPIYRLLIWTMRFLGTLLRIAEPPPVTMFNMIRGFWKTEILHTVAALDIAEILGEEGPLSTAALASKLDVQEDRLYRLLRGAVQIGLFQVATQANGDVMFQNNRMSALLRGAHPNGLKHMVLHMVENDKPAWDKMVWAVRTGKNPFRHTHDGMSEFEYFEANPDREIIFSRAMHEVDSLGTHVAVSDYNWDQYTRIIDVAGAYGYFLAKIIRKHPEIAGVLFDQAQVIERAEDVWSQDASLIPLRAYVEFVSGDFFKPETLPQGQDGDAYLLRLILHDWSDTHCVNILKSIRKAMGSANCKLLIIETTMGDEFVDPVLQRALMDIHMMVTMDGAERNALQWKHLFGSTGFQFKALRETRGVFSIVEADPVSTV